MARRKFSKTVLAYRAEYRAELKKRFKREHGSIDIAASACCIDRNTFYRQLNNETSALPESVDLLLSAEALNVSPAWLAFGIGSREPLPAQLGALIGEELETAPELAWLIQAWLSFPERRNQVTGWARDILQKEDLKGFLLGRAAGRGEPGCAEQSALVPASNERMSPAEVAARIAPARPEAPRKVPPYPPHTIIERPRAQPYRETAEGHGDASFVSEAPASTPQKGLVGRGRRKDKSRKAPKKP